MSDLSKKKKELELKRVIYYREEMYFNIEERKADIDRIQANIDIQTKRIEELKKELGIE